MPRLFLSYLSLLAGISVLFGHCNAEPPNPLYKDHMNDATAVYNMTLFIIPYSKADLQGLVGYPLLSPSFTTPEGTAPLLLQIGKLVDIRQSVAQIPELMSAGISIPFVDRLKNGKTAFSYSKYTFNDQIIPATVSSLAEGYQNEVTTFTPPHDAYGSSEGVRSCQVKQTIVPPAPVPIGGPGLSVPTLDATFTPLSSSDVPAYPQSVYEQLLNGPIFGYGLKCGTITTYFNFTFTNPKFVEGDITLYGPPGVHFPKTMSFPRVPGLTATVAEIQGTFPPVDCSTLA